MDENYCHSCGRRDRALRPVPLWLRIAAFPIIAIICLRRMGDWQLTDEFCKECRPKQIFCYVIVAIWAASFVGFMIWDFLHGKNLPEK